ncbi:hypothetical protein F7725_026882 [Dissostichus mawsoni]|uniref:FADD n=1 Tax=Dissostichus mawsoni TaxID=36200 RepID=A0A7J5X9C1_DISMA|nr:hypothetical protein F7725_026882 [Dissostichus mawsoni]
MSSLQYNSLLLYISNQLTDKQLEDLKFLCRDMLGKRELEKISSGVRFFQLLTERGKLGADNTDCLSRFLTEIHRQDLARDKLGIASEVIVENLGRNWRKLGRSLGLTEVKIDSVSTRHPTDLEETTRELLKEWRRSRGAQARTQELIQALRACMLNRTADQVEDSLFGIHTTV